VAIHKEEEILQSQRLAEAILSGEFQRVHGFPEEYQISLIGWHHIQDHQCRCWRVRDRWVDESHEDGLTFDQI